MYGDRVSNQAMHGDSVSYQAMYGDSVSDDIFGKCLEYDQLWESCLIDQSKFGCSVSYPVTCGIVSHVRPYTWVVSLIRLCVVLVFHIT